LPFLEGQASARGTHVKFCCYCLLAIALLAIGVVSHPGFLCQAWLSFASLFENRVQGLDPLRSKRKPFLLTGGIAKASNSMF
jgi:hypothetical protein